MLPVVFLSTLSLRRATKGQALDDVETVDFYPRSPCGERPMGAILILKASLFLSTLSLRRATILPHHGREIIEFLSTLSLRRATAFILRIAKQGRDFYPRSPCGERRWLRCWQLAARDISIHALLAESDSALACSVGSAC